MYFVMNIPERRIVGTANSNYAARQRRMQEQQSLPAEVKCADMADHPQ